ncbi:MAG: CPBP family intramembrane metalloprotease [Acidimicrobiales bacterium]|nr:CPBP family intramembrane metalloprotease [Acidimicrobiales bacterium]
MAEAVRQPLLEPHRLRVRDAINGLLLSSVAGLIVTGWRLWGENDRLAGMTDAEFAEATFGPEVWGLGAAALFQLFWIFWIGVSRNADPIRHFGLRFESADVLLGVAGYVLVFGASWVAFNWIVSDSETDSGVESQVPGSLANVPERYVLALILIVGVAVPFIEEVFFRGMVLRALERGFGTVLAIVGSSVVFGLAHFRGFDTAGYAVIGFATVAGLVFAALTVYTGRIAASTIAHMLNNTIVMLLVTS